MSRVLAVVEDPGAANGMVGLEQSLQKLGIDLRIYASGSALTYAPGIGLNARALPSESAAEILSGIAPDAMLVGTSENPDAFTFGAVAEARARSIPAFGFVDGPANAAHRFRGHDAEPLAHAPEFLLVSDEMTRTAFIELGMAPENVHTVGHPNMDRVRARRRSLEKIGKPNIRQNIFPNIPANQKIVLFAAELSDGLDSDEFRKNQDYTLIGGGDSDGRTEVCLEETIDALHRVDLKTALIVRLHPKNDETLCTPYMKDLAGLSKGGDPLEAVFASDLVVGMTSMLLFETAVLGVPAISLTPRKSETDWLASIGLGLTPHVCTREALSDILGEALHPPGLSAPANIDVFVPAGSADRIAARLAAAIGEKQEAT